MKTAFCIVCKGFDSFVYCPLVFSKMLLPRKMFALLSTGVFDSFMYCPLVFSKITLCSCMIFALLARVLDSFMYCFLMFRKFFLLRKGYSIPIHCILSLVCLWWNVILKKTGISTLFGTIHSWIILHKKEEVIHIWSVVELVGGLPWPWHCLI